MAMTLNAREDVRRAAELAMHYWPNAHLGDCSRRDDLRSAFRFMRSRLNRGWPIQSAAGDLERDAYRHADM